jgi:5'(3')-deoxyribonucleotidase
LQVIEKIFNIDEFWLTIPIMENSQEILEKLNRDYNVFVATIARKKAIKYDAREAKKKYLKKYYPYIDTTHILFRHDKWNINYHYIMDDSPEILINCANRGKGQIIKFELKYNEELFADHSVKNWKQVEKIFYN